MRQAAAGTRVQPFLQATRQCAPLRLSPAAPHQGYPAAAGAGYQQQQAQQIYTCWCYCGRASIAAFLAAPPLPARVRYVLTSSLTHDRRHQLYPLLLRRGFGLGGSRVRQLLRWPQCSMSVLMSVCSVAAARQFDPPSAVAPDSLKPQWRAAWVSDWRHSPDGGRMSYGNWHLPTPAISLLHFFPIAMLVFAGVSWH
jgi:hypothetical protein